jgi:molybdate transport system substrate-binding protein
MAKTLRLIPYIIGVFAVFGPHQARADKVNVAVAANFTETAKEIARVFEEKTGHEAVLSFGASGQFYSQIKEGAPFQVFLSADNTRPKKLIDEGFGSEDEEFTYAIGRLVLWSRKAGLVISEETLRRGDFHNIAIANPASAPYGAAAVDVMKAIDVYASLQPKIVQGASIAQAFQFVNTDNAEYGFIALSQVPNLKEGSWWIVPDKYYKKIRQDALLLKSGEKNNAARAFIKFLKSSVARSIIEKSGYETEAIASRQE